MDINNLQRTLPQSYHVDAGRIRERLQQADKGIAAGKWQGDSVDISGEGRRALRKKMSAAKRMEPSGDIGRLSPINSGAYGMMNDFEKVMSELGGGSVSDEFVTKEYSQEDVDALKARFEEKEGIKTDTFDSYVNKMASAYQLLKDRIEEKYAASGGGKEYYTAEDGSTQELTKEKELEMLDKAYETHSRFMATNTQIWSELQGFKAQTVYHSGGSEKEAAAVKEQAYHAFMDAVSEKNGGRLKQEKGSLNQFRLDLGISPSARNTLNGIWDYYANLKH
ncbi:hypothetical protein E5329_21440 [Petralouisia muris]|uniref:Uncharacterized protein n=1 Tax=Petralouisia muris TaxID=3032872 RepID=A0AC61RQJ8_9FIRM|nr:hypothetical protein [Petralouisia muris]TGY91358.1 hypothetical protein E5329_21440 [Petralouisia muris]